MPNTMPSSPGSDPGREADELTPFARAGALLTVADAVCANGSP